MLRTSKEVRSQEEEKRREKRRYIICDAHFGLSRLLGVCGGMAEGEDDLLAALEAELTAPGRTSPLLHEPHDTEPGEASEARQERREREAQEVQDALEDELERELERELEDAVGGSDGGGANKAPPAAATGGTVLSADEFNTVQVRKTDSRKERIERERENREKKTYQYCGSLRNE